MHHNPATCILVDISEGDHPVKYVTEFYTEVFLFRVNMTCTVVPLSRLAVFFLRVIISSQLDFCCVGNIIKETFVKKVICILIDIFRCPLKRH